MSCLTLGRIRYSKMKGIVAQNRLESAGTIFFTLLFFVQLPRVPYFVPFQFGALLPISRNSHLHYLLQFSLPLFFLSFPLHAVAGCSCSLFLSTPVSFFDFMRSCDRIFTPPLVMLSRLVHCFPHSFSLIPVFL